MDTIRITVPLTQLQARALIDTAERECRHPREQARYLILRALGLLPDPDPEPVAPLAGTAPRQPAERQAVEVCA